MSSTKELSSKEIAKMVDLSCVRADNTIEEIATAVEIAKKFDCICVHALPAHIPALVEMLKDRPDIMIGAPIGFPAGASTTEVKIEEGKGLKAMGVQEMDMVINIGWLKAGRYDDIKNEIKSVIKAIADVPLKVILECHHLSDAEIVKACELCVECGVQFVKSSTGWAPTGATMHSIELMIQAVKGKCEVKAAGGIKDRETIQQMYDMGVTRFGVGYRTIGEILED